jgi:hypothetical protein
MFGNTYEIYRYIPFWRPSLSHLARNHIIIPRGFEHVLITDKCTIFFYLVYTQIIMAIRFQIK